MICLHGSSPVGFLFSKIFFLLSYFFLTETKLHFIDSNCFVSTYLLMKSQHWYSWCPGAALALGHQLWQCWQRPLTHYGDTRPQWVEKINWHVQYMVIEASNQSEIIGIITCYVLSYECDQLFCNNILTCGIIHWRIVTPYRQTAHFMWKRTLFVENIILKRTLCV